MTDLSDSELSPDADALRRQADADARLIRRMAYFSAYASELEGIIEAICMGLALPDSAKHLHHYTMAEEYLKARDK